MKINTIILGLILICISAFGQKNNKCEQILKKEIYLSDFQDNMEELIRDFQTFIYCEFDSIDYQIFMGPQGNMPIFVQSMIALQDDTFKNEKITFLDLKDFLQKFKRENQYQQIREIVEAQNKIIQKKATIEKWDNEKQLLSQMGLTENNINDIHKIVEKNENKLYSEIFKIYSDTLMAREERQLIEKEERDAAFKLNNPDLELLINGLYTYNNYELGLTKAKEQNKPILLYFNAYGSINAREFEYNILTSTEIQDYINKNIIFVNLYTDNRTLLDEKDIYYSEILKKDIKYKGQINLELEMILFGANVQPLLVLLDNKGKEISKITNASNIERFMMFLNSSNK